MSENTPTPNDPQPQSAAAAQSASEAQTASEVRAADATHPPLPPQAAADAAQAAPAVPTSAPAPTANAFGQQPAAHGGPQSAPHGAPQGAPYGAPYGAQQPYTAPQARMPEHQTAAYGTQPYGYGTAPYGTVPTAPGEAPTASAPSAPSAKVGAGKIVGIMVAAALVGGAAGIGGAAAGASIFPSSQSVVTSSPQNVTVNDTGSVNQTTAIAAKVVPSVVTISASAGSSGGTGSGVILTADGYVVTNTHVVTLDGETSDAALTVTTSDGKVYQATVVGTDPTYDLAVIKLKDASGLTPIEFGDSGKLNVGDQTVAVGAPLGLSNTVTTGIVSALNRSIQIASSAVPDGGDQQEQTPGQGDSPFQFDFGQGQQQSASGSISIAVVQTDAAINPGNSGGALVNSKGELVGINVAIASAGGSSSSGQSGSIGVGFSIPSSVVKRITDELISDGAATHGLLGAMVGNAAAQEGATNAGAYISDVTGGGAAAAAGLKKGDVVTSFNGFPITDATDLTAQVRALAGGSSASIVYIRDGKTASGEVTLGTLTQ